MPAMPTQNAYVPPDPDALLRRKEAANALTKEGFKTAPATLAGLVTRCGGPPMEYYGRIPLYRWKRTLGWAQAKLSAPRTSSSEIDAPKAGA